MAAASRQEPKFSWDYDVPDDAFWNSLDHNVGRCFVACYTALELSQMSLDASLPEDKKLQLLLGTLINTFDQKEQDAAPARLRDVDNKTWTQLKSSTAGMYSYMGDHSAAEKEMRELYEFDGKKDMCALFSLGWFRAKQGRYAEAEAAALEVLPWLKGLPKLGPNSPQALGCMRLLAESVGKQGRLVEAREWIEKCERSIEEMGKGQFAKYVDDEKKGLEEVIRDLEEWKLARSSRM